MLNSTQRFVVFANLLVLAIVCATPSAWASADLQAVAFSSMSPNPIAPGAHPQSVTFTFANNGPEVFDAITYELYLSRNTVFGDSDDVKIGEYDEQFWPGCLYPGLFEDVTLSSADPAGMSWFTIPSTASGTYYVFLRVIPTPYSSQTDTNMANNYICSTTAISVGVPACAYSINPASLELPASEAMSFNVNISATGGSCLWAADNLGVNWISFSTNRGTGPGYLWLAVAANDTCLARTAKVTIAGETLMVTQPAGTGAFSLNSTNWSPSLAAQSTNVLVTASLGCNWSVINPQPTWITVIPSGGTGNGEVAISVSGNGSGLPRSCTLTIAGQAFVITQAETCMYAIRWSNRPQPPIPPIPYTNTISASHTLAGTDRIVAGGDSYDSVTIPASGAGLPKLSINTLPGCDWSVLNRSDWITASPTSGVGSATVTLTVASNSTTTVRSGLIIIAGQVFTVNQAGSLIGPVMLLTPQNNYAVGRYSIFFSWKAFADPDYPAWYHLSITNNNGQKYFETWVQSTSYLCTNVFDIDNYSWAVQGWNAKGLGPWSSVGHFRAERAAPRGPLILSPDVGESLSSPVVNYCWTPENATWYELYIMRNGVLYMDKWVQSYDLHGLSNFSQAISGHDCGQYTLWLRGWNPDGFGAWSMGTFTNYFTGPGKLALVYPTGTVALVKQFSWGEDPAADWYCLSVNRNGAKYISKWLQTPSCDLDTNLPVGSYTWTVQAWNLKGLGPVSDTGSFTVVAPGTPIEPVGTITDANPCYRWWPEASSTWYELYVMKDGALFYDQWKPLNSLDGASQTVTPVYLGTCPTLSHTPGNYSWWVRYWSPATGTGAWSSTASFTIAP